MAIQTYRIGVPKVFLPQRLSSDVGNKIAAVHALTFTASAATPTSLLLNDANPDLDTTASYYVTIAPVGEDKTNGGITFGATSPVTGPITVTAGQGILVNVANANYVSNMSSAMAMAVFLRKNSGNYQLQGYAYIDPSNDFNYMITSEPLATASSYTAALLQSTTADDAIGSRVPYAITYAALTPTTGGVNVSRDVASVTVSPDNAPDYQLATARGTTITFGLLPNDIKQVVQANAGNYAKYSVSGGHIVETSNMSLATAVALITGNMPLKLVLPPDANRVQEIRLYMGTITQNQSSGAEPWSKTSTTPLQFTFANVLVDALLNDVQVEVCYKFKV